MSEHPLFDPSDPFAPLPPKPPAPPPRGKARSGPGPLHLVLTVASIAGLIVLSPILLTLKTADEDTAITGPLIFRALGFMLSLVVFAGTLGVRVVHWLAGAFVNLLFNMDGSGWTWEERRRIEKEEKERLAKRLGKPDA